MDAKITKLRLSRMLSYDWIKILAIIVGAIFLWVLIFTSTATRVMPSQQFMVCNYVGNDLVKSAYKTSLSVDFEKGVFTHEVLETDTIDLAAQEAGYSYQLLQTRTITNQVDLVFVSTQSDKTSQATVNSDGTTTYAQTYLESFTYGYYPELLNLDPTAEDGYFKQLENYLKRYYGEEFATGTVDKELVEEDFRARIARNKDKRYKKENEIRKGIEGEVERLEKYRAALLDFYRYLDAGYVTPTLTKYVPDEQTAAMGVEGWEKVYSINICPNEQTMGKLSEYVSYTTAETDAQGVAQTKVSAKDMNVCLFDSNGEECYRYEGLVYLTNLIKRVVQVSA